MPQKQTLAILVGGGPASGINGVIAAATIEAINSGCALSASGKAITGSPAATPRTRRRCRSASSAASTLPAALFSAPRAPPPPATASLERAVATLRELSVRYLVCIGG